MSLFPWECKLSGGRDCVSIPLALGECLTHSRRSTDKYFSRTNCIHSSVTCLFLGLGTNHPCWYLCLCFFCLHGCVYSTVWTQHTYASTILISGVPVVSRTKNAARNGLVCFSQWTCATVSRTFLSESILICTLAEIHRLVDNWVTSSSLLLPGLWY